MRFSLTPTSLFTLGPLFVGFCGFWTGGAQAMRADAERDAGTLAQSQASADAVVTSVYRTKSSKYRADYQFAIPGGQIYAGNFTSDSPVREGGGMKIFYAKADPVVSRPVGQSLPAGAPPPAIGAGMGLAIVGLLVWGSRRNLAMPWPTLGLFVLVAGTAAMVGAMFGLRLHGERYVVQVGDQAWSSPSFHNFHPGGVNFTLDGSGLVVGSTAYGPVRNHAHVWLREDGVFIDGRQVNSK